MKENRDMMVGVDHPTLWIIEDELIMRSYFDMVLHKESWQLMFFEDVYTAQQVSDRPDLILMDCFLKHGTTLGFCRQLRQQWPDIPIIMTAARKMLPDRLACLEAGADLFLGKPLNIPELKLYIHNFLERAQAQSTTAEVATVAWEREGLCLNPRLMEAAWRGESLSLTPREYQLFEMLAHASPHMQSRSELCQALWALAEPPQQRSLEQYIRRLRFKLRNFHTRGLRIKTHYRKGYSLEISTVGT